MSVPQDLEKILDRHPLWIDPGSVLSQAIELLQSLQGQADLCGYVLVGSAEQLLGVVTEREILRGVSAGLEIDGLRVEQVMSPLPPPIKDVQIPDWVTLAERMQQHQIRFWPVKDAQGQILGVIPQEQMLRVCLRSQSEQRARPPDMELQAELEFRTSIERSIPIGIAAADFTGRQTYVNDTFAQMLGWPKEELLDRSPPYVYWPPEEIDRITSAFEEGLAQGRPPLGWELTFMRRDGERFPVRILDAPVRDGQGQIIGMMASAQDITVERQILDQVKFQAAILDHVKDAVVVVDRNQKVIYWNDRAEQIYGFTQEEALQKSLQETIGYNWIHPQDEQDAWQALESAGSWQGEVIHRRKLGETFFAEISVSILTNEWGAQVGFLAVVRDISDRKSIEIALRESEEKRQLALDLTQTGHWSFQVNTGEAIWSDTHFRLMGIDPKQDPSNYLTWRDRVHPCDLTWVEQAFYNALEHRSQLEVEYRIIRPDGEIRWMLTKGHGVYDDHGRAVQMVGVMIDITERKLMEQRLQESESRFINLVANIPGAVFQYVLHDDGSDQVLYMSPGCYGLWEVGPEILQANSQIMWDMVHPDDLPAVVTSVINSAQILGPWDHSWRITTPSGKQKWLQGAGQPQAQENGDVIWDSIILDITDRKQAELETKRRLEQLQLLKEITQGIRQSLDLQTIFDTAVVGTGHLIQADQVTISQYRPELSLWICSSEYNARPHQPVALNTQIPDRNNTITARLKQGEIICINDTSQITDQINQQFAIEFPGAWLIIPIQIDSQTWGAMALHHFYEPLEWQDYQINLTLQIVDQLGVAIHQAQLFKQLTDINSELSYQVEVRNAELHTLISYERLLRLITDDVRASLDEAEILETTVRELTQALNLGACTVCLINPEQGSYTVAYECVGPMTPINGETIEIDPVVLAQLRQGLTLYYTTDHSIRGRCTLLICPIWKDDELYSILKLVRSPRQGFLLHEIRLAEQVAGQCGIGIRQAHLYQSVQQQVDQLMELNDLKEEFLNLVSHELRTPLTSMKMALTLLEMVGLTDPQVRYFNLLKQEWKKELDLVNNLLDLQRLESGKRTLELSEIILQDWIPELLSSFDLRCQEEQITLSSHLPDQLLSLSTDTELLMRILSELLNNAVKYTPHDHQIQLKVNSIPSQIQFQIINTGVEIPSDQLPHIFEKFHRVVTLDRYQRGGTGLGLPLVKKGVELLGGEIEVWSEAGSTCFQVTLPRDLQGNL